MEQLKEITAIIYEMFNFYYGNKIYLVIALDAAVYAAIRGTRRTRIIVGASLIIMLVIWNPLIYKVLFSGIVFWRLFWLVPTFLLITLGFAVALSRLNKKVFRLIFTIAAMAVIMFLGTNIYKELWSDTYRDYYKLPRGTASVGQIMLDIGSLSSFCRRNARYRRSPEVCSSPGIYLLYERVQRRHRAYVRT